MTVTMTTNTNAVCTEYRDNDLKAGDAYKSRDPIASAFFEPGMAVVVRFSEQQRFKGTFIRYQGNRAEVKCGNQSYIVESAQVEFADALAPPEKPAPLEIMDLRSFVAREIVDLLGPETVQAGLAASDRRSTRTNSLESAAQTSEPGADYGEPLKPITETGSTPSWADINEAAQAEDARSQGPSEIPADDQPSRETSLEPQTYYDTSGNILPAWVGHRNTVHIGYTKMWYYNKYWGYVEPFSENARDVFLHGGKVVNVKKNVTKAQKKREKGMETEDHSRWLSHYPVVPKVVRYQKILMTNFFMNMDEDEGRQLAADTIVVIDSTWNKTKALAELRAVKGVKIFEDKKHNIEREYWHVGDECLARWPKDGEYYPARIIDIGRATYPEVPKVTVSFHNFEWQSCSVEFSDIDMPEEEKRSLDTRRHRSSRMRAEAGRVRNRARRSTRSTVSTGSTLSRRSRSSSATSSSAPKRHCPASAGRSSPRSSMNGSRRVTPSSSPELKPSRPLSFADALTGQRRSTMHPNKSALTNTTRNGEDAAASVRPMPVHSTRAGCPPPGLEHTAVSLARSSAPSCRAADSPPTSGRSASPSPEREDRPLVRMLPTRPCSTSPPPDTQRTSVVSTSSQPRISHGICVRPMTEYPGPSKEAAMQQVPPPVQIPATQMNNGQMLPPAMVNNQMLPPAAHAMQFQQYTQYSSGMSMAPMQMQHMALAQARGSMQYPMIPLPQASAQMVPQHMQMQPPHMTSPMTVTPIMMPNMTMQNGVPMQTFQYIRPTASSPTGSITTWTVDSDGRWLCRGCGTRNCCTGYHCATCSAPREAQSIPINQVSVTPVQLAAAPSPTYYQLPVAHTPTYVSPRQQAVPQKQCAPSPAAPTNRAVTYMG